ncbi:hypothetical protein ATB93_13170 [Sphingomonas sp. WG]|nr:MULTISPECIES: PEPxxWA-CTERM sorting domain-containing protein [unclassified Sphingomonas]KTF68670.1 hypothetical protein ATB93_13170 [Sphingomonas sp. WG]
MKYLQALSVCALLASPGSALAQISVDGQTTTAGSYFYAGSAVSGSIATDPFAHQNFDGSDFATSGGDTSTGRLYAAVGAAGVASAFASASWNDTLRFTVNGANANSVTTGFFYVDPLWGGFALDEGYGNIFAQASLTPTNGIGSTGTVRIESINSFAPTSEGWNDVYYTTSYAELYSFSIFGDQQDFTFNALVQAASESFTFTGAYIQADVQLMLKFALPANVSLSSSSGTIPTLSIPGYTPTEAAMPTSITSNGGFQFDFVAVEGEMLYFDPEVAVGYDYEVSSGSPNILAAIFPTITGDLDGYDIYALSDLNNPLFTGVMGGQLIDFTSLAGFGSGISGFALRGIDVGANLDPANTMAFVTGLTFAQSGVASLTQTPVTVSVGGAVPEPGAWAMMIAGFGLAGSALRRKRLHAAVS